MVEAKTKNFLALIMAGGSGTRFWPLSKPQKPKQYLNLFGQRSLIQATVDRLKNQTPLSNIFICSGENQSGLLKEQLPEISEFIFEPEGRNTAPCLMLSVATLLHRGFEPSTVMGIFPADHIIHDDANFFGYLRSAIEEARSTKCLVTFGIKPTSPHTGYGYIEKGAQCTGNSFTVKKFVEKPSLEKAREYLAQGDFYWNAGIFIWRLDAIAEAFATFLPMEWESLQSAVKTNTVSKIYPNLKSQPIDTAVLEKASNVRVIPAEMKWSDIGSWSALLEQHQLLSGGDNITLSKDPKSVTLMGSHNTLVVNETSKKIVVIGTTDLIVVETETELLISHRNQDQRVKEIK